MTDEYFENHVSNVGYFNKQLYLLYYLIKIILSQAFLTYTYFIHYISRYNTLKVQAVMLTKIFRPYKIITKKLS